MISWQVAAAISSVAVVFGWALGLWFSREILRLAEDVRQDAAADFAAARRLYLQNTKEEKK